MAQKMLPPLSSSDFIRWSFPLAASTRRERRVVSAWTDFFWRHVPSAPAAENHAHCGGFTAEAPYPATCSGDGSTVLSLHFKDPWVRVLKKLNCELMIPFFQSTLRFRMFVPSLSW